ncbi:MAG TPA: UPF0149 family protein [Rhizomicrobium sp.]|jgi:uncharacterized protein|nr:UPF0149 family protein [Rhizomicrobium sp.]
MLQATPGLADHSPAFFPDDLTEGSASHCMGDSELDGYLTAIAIGPEIVEPGEWMAHVWCGQCGAPDNLDDPQGARNAVLSRYALIRRSAREDLLEPFVAEDERGPFADPWVRGFLRGVDLRRQAWAPLLGSELGKIHLLVLLACCRDHDGERFFPQAALDDVLPPLSEILAKVAARFARYWRDSKRAADFIPQSSGGAARTGPKTGRNEPCPCGSCRKFKKCCGGNA